MIPSGYKKTSVFVKKGRAGMVNASFGLLTVITQEGYVVIKGKWNQVDSVGKEGSNEPRRKEQGHQKELHHIQKNEYWKETVAVYIEGIQPLHCLIWIEGCTPLSEELVTDPPGEPLSEYNIKWIPSNRCNQHSNANEVNEDSPEHQFHNSQKSTDFEGHSIG